MKIFVARKGRAQELMEELIREGTPYVVPVMSIMKRINRRSRKKVLHKVWVLPRTIFVDREDHYGLKWVQYAWARDGQYIEVSQQSVRDFVDSFATRTLKVYAAGDVFTIPFGPFEGYSMTVLSDNGNKIKGLINMSNGLQFPITFVWLTNER